VQFNISEEIAKWELIKLTDSKACSDFAKIKLIFKFKHSETGFIREITAGGMDDIEETLTALRENLSKPVRTCPNCGCLIDD